MRMVAPGIARRRWHVAYTLLNNPGLCADRRHGRHVERKSTSYIDHIRKWYRKAKSELSSKNKNKSKDSDLTEAEEAQKHIWAELEKHLFSRSALNLFKHGESGEEEEVEEAEQEQEEEEPAAVELDEFVQTVMLTGKNLSNEPLEVIMSDEEPPTSDHDSTSAQGDSTDDANSNDCHSTARERDDKCQTVNVAEANKKDSTHKRRSKVTQLSSQNESSFIPVNEVELVAVDIHEEMTHC